MPHATMQTDVEPIIDQVLTQHHRYIRDAWPDIDTQLAVLVEQQGARHPELVTVAKVFGELVDDLVLHLHTEEVVLFPHVLALAHAAQPSGPFPVPPFGTVLNPINTLEQEHTHSLEALARLEALTDGYRAPEDAPGPWRATYLELAAFDRDLRRHIDLEHTILFPAAVELERA